MVAQPHARSESGNKQADETEIDVKKVSNSESDKVSRRKRQIALQAHIAAQVLKVSQNCCEICRPLLLH